MKIKKRVTIIADVLVDEDFDTGFLHICEDVTPKDIHETFVGGSDQFELVDYIYQGEVEITE